MSQARTNEDGCFTTTQEPVGSYSITYEEVEAVLLGGLVSISSVDLCNTKTTEPEEHTPCIAAHEACLGGKSANYAVQEHEQFATSNKESDRAIITSLYPEFQCDAQISINNRVKNPQGPVLTDQNDLSPVSTPVPLTLLPFPSASDSLLENRQKRFIQDEVYSDCSTSTEDDSYSNSCYDGDNCTASKSKRKKSDGSFERPFLLEDTSVTCEPLAGVSPGLSPSFYPSPTPSPSTNLKEDEETGQQSRKQPQGDDSPVSYKNDQSTMHLFNFKGNGNKALFENKVRVGTRKHSVCSFRNETDCKAKYSKTLDNDNLELGSPEFEFVHNHLPPLPSQRRLQKAVRDDASSKLKTGASIGNIHQGYVNSASLPLSSATVPSNSQLKNIKKYDKSKGRLSQDALLNALKKHGKCGTYFLRAMEFSPKIHLVLASDFGLDILINSKWVAVDGTFNTTECGLVLTTLLGEHEGVPIPGAFFLSNSKKKKAYKYFYEKIKDETNNLMMPVGVAVDFEEALSDAVPEVFPAAIVLNDYFHFKQAQVRQAGQLGLKSLAAEISHDCSVLWYAETKKDFDYEVVKFLHKWDKCAPRYSTYFRTNWLNRYPPEKWASFGRPSDAPSGSGTLEAFHSSLEARMSCRALAIDDMVDFLFEIDKCNERTVGDPRLWAEKKNAHDYEQERHRKRQRLVDYMPREKNTDRRSQPLSVHNLRDPDQGEDQSSTEGVSLTTTTSGHYSKPQRSTLDPAKKCPMCRRKKRCKDCPRKICLNCCLAVDGGVRPTQS